MITGKFPSLRLRRSRKNDWSRRLIEENNLSASDFILPIFLIDGKNKKQPINSMPGVYRYTIDKLSPLIDRAIKNKLPMVALLNGLKLVGDYLEKTILKPNSLSHPLSRLQFINTLK